MAFIQQFLCLLPIFMNTIMNNCAFSWMANVVYFMVQPGSHQPSATLDECGWMASCLQIGRISLAIPAGILTDKFGSKYIIITVGCIYLASWIALSASYSIWVILIVRFFQGCAAALSMSTGPNMIGEICSPKYRGFMFGLLKVVGTLGNIGESVIARVSSSYSLTAYATTVVSIFLFPTIALLIESPYHLIRTFRYEECERVLAKLRRGQSSEIEIRAEYESLKQFIEEERSKKVGRNWLQYLATRSIRKPLICCMLLSSLIFANGNQVLFVYASVVIPPTDYFAENSYPLIMAIVQLISLTVSVPLLEALPRRQLLMPSLFLSFLLQSCNGFVYYGYANAVDERQRQILLNTFLVGVLMFWALSSAVIEPLYMAVRSELLPVNIRGFGISICAICQAMSAILSYNAFNFVRTRFGTAANFAIFAIDSLVVVAIIYFLLPETRGKTLAEVQKSNSNNDEDNQRSE